MWHFPQLSSTQHQIVLGMIVLFRFIPSTLGLVTRFDVTGADSASAACKHRAPGVQDSVA